MTGTCPCGASLDSAAAEAHGVCNRCRVDAKKRPRKRLSKPDFVDVPMPGLEDDSAFIRTNRAQEQEGNS